MESILFVVGFFRSGTSLLYTLLNQHPAIALTYEGNFLKFWPVLRVKGLRNNWQRRLEFWDQTFSRHGLTLTQAAGARNRREAALALYHSYASRRAAPIAGTKTPAYYNRLQRVAYEFPEAKFIVLWRSPWEILRSVRVAGHTERFFASRSWAQYTAIGVKQLLHECQSLRTNRAVFELNYRLLTKDPSGTLQKICEFLNIPFNQKMVQLNDGDFTAVPPGSHHANLRSRRILEPQPKRGEVLSPEDQAILAKAFGDLEPAPWETPDQIGIGADAARCAQQLRLSLAENCWRARFETYDFLVRLIYGCAPFFMLKAWRSWRNRRFGTAAEIAKSVAPTLNS